MKITKYHVLIGVLVIIIVAVSAFLGIWLGSRESNDYETMAEGIIIENNGEEYESTMLSAYTEYTDLLSDLGISEDVFLTSGDFEQFDYIVDYIYYEDDLEIDEINLNITDEGTIIEYVVNKEITNSDKILIYFIRLDKGQLSNYSFASREFKVK